MAPHGSISNSRVHQIRALRACCCSSQKRPCSEHLFAKAGSSLDSPALPRIVDIVSNAKMICTCELIESPAGVSYRGGLRRGLGLKGHRGRGISGSMVRLSENLIRPIGPPIEVSRLSKY